MLQVNSDLETAFEKIVCKGKKPENICCFSRCFGLNGNSNALEWIGLDEIVKMERSCRFCNDFLGKTIENIQGLIKKAKSGENQICARLQEELKTVKNLRQLAQGKHDKLLEEKRRKNKKERARSIVLYLY